MASSAAEDNRETTLIVPDLGAARVAYGKCLVDEGARFFEHAVVICDEVVPARFEFEMIAKVLSAARPTAVTFWRPDGPPLQADGQEARGAARAACAVCSCLDKLSPGVSCDAFGLNVSRQGRFYLCEAILP